MASRASRPAPATSSSRQNEYFVPRDGIDREVISADICRYLGNDALVRPGMYENPQNGQVTHGYYITAYRNLTTAMIEDLKADSARWENERRAQNSRHSGGSFAPREMGGHPARAASNSPIVSYHQSETHQSRQHYGPTETPHQQDPYAREAPRPYPGSGAAGYPGAASNYQTGPSQAQGQQSYPGGHYPGYPPGQNPTMDNRYASPGGNSSMPPPPTGYQEPPYVATGANNKTSRGYAPSSNDGPYSARSAAPPAPSGYATTGPQQPQFPGASGYSYSGQVPTSAAPGYAPTMHPQDPFMGRASPGGQPGQPQPQGYPPQPPQQPAYGSSQTQQSQHASDRHRSSRR